MISRILCILFPHTIAEIRNEAYLSGKEDMKQIVKGLIKNEVQ